MRQRTPSQSRTHRNGLSSLTKARPNAINSLQIDDGASNERLNLHLIFNTCEEGSRFTMAFPGRAALPIARRGVNGATTWLADRRFGGHLGALQTRSSVI